MAPARGPLRAGSGSRPSHAGTSLVQRRRHSEALGGLSSTPGGLRDALGARNEFGDTLLLAAVRAGAASVVSFLLWVVLPGAFVGVGAHSPPAPKRGGDEDGDEEDDGVLLGPESAGVLSAREYIFQPTSPKLLSTLARTLCLSLSVSLPLSHGVSCVGPRLEPNCWSPCACVMQEVDLAGCTCLHIAAGLAEPTCVAYAHARCSSCDLRMKIMARAFSISPPSAIQSLSCLYTCTHVSLLHGLGYPFFSYT